MQIAIPSRGELREQPLPELLLSLHETQKSCLLVIQRGGVRKEIVLRDGDAARIISTDPAESLSHYIGLSAAAQEVVFRHLQDHPNTFLEAIVARGLAERSEIERRLEDAAKSRLFDCLSWERGTYELQHLDSAQLSRPARKLFSLPESVFAGLRETSDMGRVMALLQPFMRSALGVAPRLEKFRSALVKAFGPDNILGKLANNPTPEELAQGSGDPTKIFSEIYVLLRTGLVTAAKTKEAVIVEPLEGEASRSFPGDPSGALYKPTVKGEDLWNLAKESAQQPENEALRKQLITKLQDTSIDDAVAVTDSVAGGWTTSSPTMLADLYYELGQLFERASSRLDLAIEKYRAALKLDPSHRNAQDALHSVLRASGDDEARGTLLSQSILAEPDPSRRATLHRMRAELFSDYINDFSGAEKDLRAALALRPFDVSILENMIALQERLGENGKVPKTAALYLERLARVYLSRETPDTNRGLSYIRRALEIDPESRDIWGMAERVLRSTGRWAELEELYRSSLTRSDAAGKEAMLRKLAGLEVFGRRGVARWACEELLKLDPSNTFARQRLRDLYEEANDHQARARLREEDIGRATNARGKNAARLELAELCLRRFSDADRASVLIGDVLEDDPYHSAAYDLAHLYLARRGHYPAYAEVLRRAVESNGWKETSELPSPERVARAAELAWVLEAQVKDPTRALSSWNRVLSLASGHAEARSAVTRLESALSGTTKELDEIAQQVRTTKKITEKAEVLRRLGQKARERDLDRAVQAYEELLEFRANDEEALKNLEEIYTARRDFGGLVSTLRRRIAVATSDEARASLLNRIAAISHERLGAPDQALRICREVLRVDAQNATALGRMERIYTQLGNTEGLLGIFAHRAQVTERGQEKTNLFRQMAKLASADIARAATFWEQVLKENPGDREALAGLEESYEQLRREPDLARVLSERAARTPNGDPELPALYKRLARLYETGVEDPARALESWEKLLALSPEDPDALSAIAASKEATGEVEAWAQVAQRLLPRLKDPLRASALASRVVNTLAQDLRQPVLAEQILSAHMARNGVRGGEHARLLAKLREQKGEKRAAIASLELEFISEDAPPRRVAIAQRIASLWRDGLSNQPQAIEAYRRLCALDPRNEAGWNALCALYDQARRDDELIGAKETLFSLASDNANRVNLLREMSTIHERRRNDLPAALQCLRRACQLVPDDQQQLQNFQSASARFGVFEPFADYLDSLGIQPRERVRRLGEVARRCREQERDINRAIECWKVAYERYSEEPESFAGLTAIVEESGRYEALVEAYESRLGLVDPLERSRLLQKIGEICEHKLGDPNRAIASFRKAFEAAPDDRQAVDGYANALEQRGRWEEYIQLYERVALEAIDPTTRGHALERVAQVTRQKLGDLSRTFEVKRRAFDLDVANAEQLRELENLAAESGAWRGLAEVYQSLVTKAKTEGSRLTRLDRLADILENRLQENTAAYQKRLEAWRLDARDATLKREAYRLADKVQDWAPIVEITLDLASRSNIADEKREFLAEAARLEEQKRHNTERAFDLHLESFILDPKKSDANEQARRLAAISTEEAQLGDYFGPKLWGKLLASYQNLLARAEEPKERLDYFHQIAEIFEGPLKDDAKAFDILELALHVDKKNTKTLDEMERLGRKSTLTPKMLKRFEEEVEKAKEARDAIPFLERLARIWDEVLNDAQRASEILRRILAMQPSHEGARTKFRDILRRLGRFDELISLLESEVADAPASPARRARLREIAGLYEEVLRNPREAQALYSKVLAEDGADYDALKNLSRLHESFGEWRKLAEVETKLAQLEADAEQAAMRHRRVAGLYENKLSLPRRAVESYREALKLIPNDLMGLRELARLLESQKRWDELVDVLGQWAEREPEDVAAPILVRRASILAERLMKAPEAARSLRGVLAKHPKNTEARRVLVEALRIEKRSAEIAELVASWETQGPVEPRLLARLGEAYAEQNDDDKAITVFTRALSADGELVEALHGLAQMHRRTGAPQSAAKLLRKEADILASRKEEGIKIAPLYEDAASLFFSLSDHINARDSLRRALALDPLRQAASQKLLDVAVAPEDFESVKLSLQGMLAKAEGQQKAALYADLGTVEWRGYRRAEAALDAFEAALESFPGHPAAVAGIAEVHRERGSWTEDAILRRLVWILNEAIEKGLGRRDPAAGRLYYHFGHVKTKLGEGEEALTLLKRARERLGGDADITLGLAELCQAASRNEDATKYYKLFCSHPDAAKRPEKLAEARLTLGQLLRRSGDNVGALDAFASAAQYEKVASRALPMAADLAELLGDAARAAELLGKQAEITTTPAARRELFSRRAEALATLGDQAGAAESIKRAIQENIGTTPFSLYARLLDLLGGLSRWDEALQIAQEATHNSKDATSDDATVLNLRAAEVFSRTGQSDKASKHIEAALAANPSSGAAFDALARFHQGRKDFKALTETYKRRLPNLAPQSPERAQILRSLAQVLLDEVKQPAEAITFARELHQQAPTDLEALALYGRAAQASKAPAQEQLTIFTTLTEAFPYKIDYLRHLGNLFEETGSEESAFWVRASLAALDVATQPELQYFQSRQQKATRALGGGGLSQLPANLYEAKTAALSKIFGDLFVDVPDLFSPVVPQGQPLSVMRGALAPRILSDLGRLLPSSKRKAYPASGDAIKALRSVQPSIEIGEKATQAPALLRFMLARATAATRSEFVLFATSTQQEAEQLFSAMLFAFDPTRKLADAPAEVQKLAAQLKEKTPARLRYQISAKLVELSNKKELPSFEEFYRGIQATLNRFAFLYCGDLGAATKCVGLTNPDASLEDRIKQSPGVADLIRFAISSTSSKLREELCFAGPISRSV